MGVRTNINKKKYKIISNCVAYNKNKIYFTGEECSGNALCMTWQMGLANKKGKLKLDDILYWGRLVVKFS